MANRRLGVICAVAFAIGATPCFADGPDPYIYAPSQAFYDWTGVYIGAHIGGANARNRAFVNAGGPDFLVSNATAFIGGAQVGLQKQLGSVVFGGELSYTGLDNMAVTTTDAILNPNLA